MLYYPRLSLKHGQMKNVSTCLYILASHSLYILVTPLTILIHFIFVTHGFLDCCTLIPQVSYNTYYHSYPNWFVQFPLLAQADTPNITHLVRLLLLSHHLSNFHLHWNNLLYFWKNSPFKPASTWDNDKNFFRLLELLHIYSRKSRALWEHSETVCSVLAPMQKTETLKSDAGLCCAIGTSDCKGCIIMEEREFKS